MDSKRNHIMHVLLSLEKGGKEGGVVNLVNNIDASRFKLSICCLESIGGLLDKIDKKRCNVFCLGKKQGKDFKIFFALAKLFREENVNVVHTHDYATFLYAGIVCVFNRHIKLIHGEHGDLPLQLHTKQLKYIWVRKLLSYKVSFFHTVSAYFKKLLHEKINIPLYKIKHIPNGLDLTRFCYWEGKSAEIENFRKSYSIAKDEFVILCVGSFYPWKNFKLVVEACSLLAKDKISFKLLLVGDGPLKEELELLVDKNNLRSKVVFLGYCKNMPDIMSACDILVQPSLTEGMSNVIIEAMASGKVVIASDAPGNKELVVDNITGYLFKSGDVMDLAKKIVMIYNDRDLVKKFGEKANELANEKYSLSRMTRDYENLYTLTIDKKDK